VNIPSDVSELAEGGGSMGGNLPAGALQKRTDFGVPGYGGPCPPEGDHPHRYLFTVFAVKTDKLDVKTETSAAVVGFNLHSNTLARAEIMGLFKR
jgi:Raf kinase inhibitor-like YbhB/YbcL family protein